MLPITEIRENFPALNREYNGLKVIYMDGPGGTQVTESVIASMVNYMSNGMANRHGEFITSLETEEIIQKARESVADLFNASPREIAFGQNATTLMFSISRALCRNWSRHDNIVVTELDHLSNVDSWASAAKQNGTEVRFLPVNTETMALDLSNLNDLIDEKTKLVAVTLASNAIGTITDVENIAKRAKEVGAVLAIDAVHAAPHFSIDIDQLNADLLFCSAYKFFGPHVGIAVIKESILDDLSVFKVSPAPHDYADKLETGTQSHEGIASIEASIDFIASLGEGSNRSEKIKSAFMKIEEHENQLVNKLREALSKIPEITIYQAPSNVAKTPTIAFTINGVDPKYVCKWLADKYSIFVSNGDFYASLLSEKLGVDKNGGWIRVGMAPYNTAEEVDRLIESIKSYIETEVKITGTVSS